MCNFAHMKRNLWRDCEKLACGRGVKFLHSP